MTEKGDCHQNRAYFWTKKGNMSPKKSFGISMSFLTEKRNWPVSFEARRGHTSSGFPPPKKRTKKFFSSHKTPQEINSAGVPSFGFFKEKRQIKSGGNTGPAIFCARLWVACSLWGKYIFFFGKEECVRGRIIRGKAWNKIHQIKELSCKTKIQSQQEMKKRFWQVFLHVFILKYFGEFWMGN